MADELIICEKPAAAQKVAMALADDKVTKKNEKGVPFYEIKHAGKSITVGAVVGHVYGLDQKDKEKGWTYPMFDIAWVPSYKVNKGSAFTKKYVDVIKKLSSGVKTFTVATDYDVEGEVIGLNVVRYICKQKDARRMKFSTLTKNELRKAYETAKSHLDWGQAHAGETRHLLDFYYGINISRALTSAIKNAGTFKVLSAGRVQGPALKIIVEREKQIQAFKPEPYWQIQMLGKANTAPIEAWHKTDKFWKKEDADQAFGKAKGAKTAGVTDVDAKSFKQKPPTPFDLTTLQTESYRCFNISPKQTLALAQDLYTGGWISYPRTSSQQLPESIGYRDILKELGKQSTYAVQTAKLLAQKELKPNNGKKSDPAHPAIYPTGHPPQKLDARQQKVYDLIVKRFFAVFGTPATRETVTITLDINTEPFISKGTRTVEKNWHELYAPYVALEEIELPALKKGDQVTVSKIDLLAKETTPPKRYTEASIIRALEKQNLGTKATRAQIIETLKDRNYVKGRKALEATDLGFKTLDVLEKFMPRIVDPELTRSFEERMEQIREGTSTPEEILSKAREVLTELLNDFKSKEKTIGKQLQETFGETRLEMKTVGTCPKDQGNLVIRRGKFGLFIACDNYPECTNTFALPHGGLVEPAGKTCDACEYPVVLIIKKGKRPQEICINQNCPKKQVDTKKVDEHPCPICKEGKMVLRKSIYGSFLGCNRYPKCKTTQKINADGTVEPPRTYTAKKTTKKSTTKKSTGSKTKKSTTKKATKKTTKKASSNKNSEKKK